MKAVKIICCFICCLVLNSDVFCQKGSADIILNRHREFLLKSREKLSIDSILRHYDEGRKQWVNIDYNDTQRAGWRLSEHLNNVLNLSMAYVDKASKYYKDPVLKSVIDGALQNWVDNKYKNSNWWHNEIGIPIIMRDIVTVLKDEITADELKGYLSVMAQHKVKGTGANLTWSADIGLYYSLLTNNYLQAKECSGLLQNEVHMSDAEGLKPDYSFHQHGERLQMYQYGASFLLTNIRLAWELRDSELGYANEKVRLLVDMLLNGWQWMARGVNTVPGTMDRSISRINATKAADIIKYIPLFIDLAPENKSELISIYKSQSSTKTFLRGFKYFPYSDMTTYHRPGFSFFLKTISTRTLATESINSENLKGKLLNSGDHYFVRSGNEYYNMMPVWDWQRLPGVTSFSDASIVNRKEFTGSVSNRQSGLTAMEYSMRDSQNVKSFEAKKLWVNHSDYMFCLMGGIKLMNLDTAFTTLDQSRGLGNVYINNQSVSSGEYQLMPGDYVYHNKLVYMPVFKQSIHLRTGPAKGSWHQINNSYSNAEIAENMVMPYINHYPDSEQSGYIIAYAKNKRVAKRINAGNKFKVIANDSLKQVLAYGGKTFFCAFYAPSGFHISGTSLSVNRPCLLMLHNGFISVSDPQHKGGTINVSYNNQNFKVELKPDGTTSTIKL